MAKFKEVNAVHLLRLLNSYISAGHKKFGTKAFEIMLGKEKARAKSYRNRLGETLQLGFPSSGVHLFFLVVVK